VQHKTWPKESATDIESFNKAFEQILTRGSTCAFLAISLWQASRQMAGSINMCFSEDAGIAWEWKGKDELDDRA